MYELGFNIIGSMYELGFNIIGSTYELGLQDSAIGSINLEGVDDFQWNKGDEGVLVFATLKSSLADIDDRDRVVEPRDELPRMLNEVEQVLGMRQDAQKIPRAAELYSNANVILGAQYNIHLRIQLSKEKPLINGVFFTKISHKRIKESVVTNTSRRRRANTIAISTGGENHETTKSEKNTLSMDATRRTHTNLHSKQKERRSNITKGQLAISIRLTKITEGTMVNSTEYRSLIGCLRYLLHTRPDLSYSVGLLSRFMQELREQHMKAIRQVLRYVQGTKDHGITYKHNGGNKIHGYSDSSYGVNTQEGKGTTGIIFYYGESPISWSTQKQATVALSSCESEFIAATAAATQALWLKRLLSKLTHSQEEKVIIQVDNKSAIALMKNPVFHGRSKHIDTKYHFIRECVEREDIQVEFVNGEYQKADILTKALPKIKFLTMRQLIGLKNLRSNVCD
ncbi:ribonuclease H-like domain, reverse transcriptase, RNA-dependent DNA polymerase [Tanacetum coccineum]